jgi:DNA-binding MarR family transcriptional regulator
VVTAEEASRPRLAASLRRLVDLISHNQGAALLCMERAGVTLPQVLLLSRLANRPRASISDLGRLTPSSLAATGQMVDRLVQHGLLQRAEDQNDRRRKAVSLSKKGRALLQSLQQARTSDYVGGLAGLSPFLASGLCDLLEKAILEIETSREASGSAR